MQYLRMAPTERLQARCQECSLRLSGDFAELHLQGADNFVTLTGRVGLLKVEGKHNTVECLDGPGRVELKGEGNRVRISLRPGRSRPPIQVEGSDQGVTYRPYKP